MAKKELPADLYERVSSQRARRIPHDLSADDVKNSVVMFRASTRMARLDDKGQQVMDTDGEVQMDLFSPGDEVPGWVMEFCNFASMVRLGRIYVRPWPTDKNRPPQPPAWDYKANKALGVPPTASEAEDAAEPSSGHSLKALRGLRSNASMRNLRDAFDKAGIEYSNAASKSELRELRTRVLDEADGKAPEPAPEPVEAEQPPAEPEAPSAPEPESVVDLEVNEDTDG